MVTMLFFFNFSYSQSLLLLIMCVHTHTHTQAQWIHVWIWPMVNDFEWFFFLILYLRSSIIFCFLTLDTGKQKNLFNVFLAHTHKTQTHQTNIIKQNRYNGKYNFNIWYSWGYKLKSSKFFFLLTCVCVCWYHHHQ